MKRAVLIIAGLFLILSLFALASARTFGICSDNQTIMMLSSSTNAHGALWNQGYNFRVCYNDIFSGVYDGSSPHECDSTDVLLYLANLNNSHASIDSSTTYSIPVCYKGLEDCKIGSCSEGDLDCNVVAYISGSGTSISNAHLSASNSPMAGYSTISCTSSKGDSKVLPSVPASACYEYDNSADCNSDSLGLALSDSGCGGDSCTCIWNETASKCYVSWSVIEVINGTTCTYSCTVSGSEATECSGGSKIVRNTASVTASPYANCPITSAPNSLNCKSSSATVACGELETNLPFFGSWQLVASLISVMFVYALFKRKRLL